MIPRRWPMTICRGVGRTVSVVGKVMRHLLQAAVRTREVSGIFGYRRKDHLMAGNASCKSEGHEMHMCALKASGFDKTHAAEFKNISADPRYKCGNCGEKAHDKDNLCNPVRL